MKTLLEFLEFFESLEYRRPRREGRRHRRGKDEYKHRHHKKDEYHERELKEQLLLEYDHDKTWAKYGEAIHRRMTDEITSDYAHPYWDNYPHVQHDPDNAPYNMAEHLPDEEMNKEDFHTVLQHGDPTPHKEYGQWIAHHYANGNINRLEDIPGRVHSALTTFHDAKRRKLLQRHGVNPDINQHRGLTALEDAVEKLPQEERKDETKPEPHEYEKHEDEHWHVYTPKTQKASCYFGRGTRWCTAATKGRNMFDHYDGEGTSRLHIFVPKQPKYPGEKYQLHLRTNQFMNEKDYGEEFQNTIGHHSDRPSGHLNHILVDAFHDQLKRDSWDTDRMKTYLSNMSPATHEKLAQHPNSLVRERVLSYSGNPKIADMLLNDPVEHVRWSVANLGHKRHLDKLVNDEAGNVRRRVAAFGHKEHLDKLVNDPESGVRTSVAFMGHKEHVEKLLDDPSKGVRDTAWVASENAKHRGVWLPRAPLPPKRFSDD